MDDPLLATLGRQRHFALALAVEEAGELCALLEALGVADEAVPGAAVALPEGELVGGGGGGVEAEDLDACA